MESNEEMTDNRVREGVKYFSEQMRKLGFLGDTVSNVGKDREAGPDPVVILKDGMAPMIKTVPQADR